MTKGGKHDIIIKLSRAAVNYGSSERKFEKLWEKYLTNLIGSDIIEKLFYGQAVVVLKGSRIF